MVPGRCGVVARKVPSRGPLIWALTLLVVFDVWPRSSNEVYAESLG